MVFSVSESHQSLIVSCSLDKVQGQLEVEALKYGTSTVGKWQFCGVLSIVLAVQPEFTYMIVLTIYL